MTYKTSGKLEFAEVKGLNVCTAPWWIETKLLGYAFELHGHDGQVIARMDNVGKLWMLPSYPWDGSSGPTDDDGAVDPVPSGVHDIAYEARRARKLPAEARAQFDKLYSDLCAERGMSPWWEPHKPNTWWNPLDWLSLLNPGHKTRYYFLRAFGGAAASPIRGPQYPKREAA